MRCSATTKAGDPCPTGASDATGFCNFHDPANNARRSEWARLGGKKAGAQKVRHHSKRKLRSIPELQALLEEMAHDVMNAASDANARAGAISKLVSQAMDLLKLSEVEKENRELREFIAQHMPEAKQALRAA